MTKKRAIYISMAALITFTLVLIFTLKPYETQASAAEKKVIYEPDLNINTMPTFKNYEGVATIRNDNVYFQQKITVNKEESEKITVELIIEEPIEAIYITPIINEIEDFSKQIVVPQNGNIAYIEIEYNIFNLKLGSSQTTNINYNFTMYIYQGEYTPGFGQGYEAGKEVGINEGQQEAKYGIFTGATFDMTAYAETDSGDPGEKWTTTNQNLQPYLSGTGIYFNNLYKLPNYSTGNGDSNSVSITIYTKPWIYQTGTNNIYFNGGNLGWTVTIIDSNNNQYSTQADDYPTGNNNRQLDFGVNANGKEIKKIEIDFSVAVNTMPGTSMQIGNTGYNTGYNAGYNLGYKDGNTEGYKKGEEIGYNNGYQVGYNEGYSKGNTDPYGLAQLMTSVVDAPVTVFSDMLNFEILGFNLLSVVVAILSIALVIKVISMFTKGK